MKLSRYFARYAPNAVSLGSSIDNGYCLIIVLSQLSLIIKPVGLTIMFDKI
jgi:hypothetical protein